MSDQENPIVTSLEQALADARSGRLTAYAFAGIGNNEHVTCYYYPDDMEGQDQSLIAAVGVVAGELMAEAAAK